MLDGTVIEIVDFGLFVRLSSGQQGVLYYSKIPGSNEKSIYSIFKVGQKLLVKIEAMDHRGEIRLSFP